MSHELSDARVCEPQKRATDCWAFAGADATIEDSAGVTPLDVAELRSDEVLNHPHAAIIRRHLGIPEAPPAAKGAALKPAIARQLLAHMESGSLEGVLGFLRGGVDVDGRVEEDGTRPLMVAVRLQQVPPSLSL